MAGRLRSRFATDLLFRISYQLFITYFALILSRPACLKNWQECGINNAFLAMNSVDSPQQKSSATPAQSAELQPQILFVASGFLMLLAVVSADVQLGSRFGMLLFYLAPIAWLAWQVGQNAALSMTVAATLARFGVEITEAINARRFGSELIWSVSSELIFFLVFVGLLLKVRWQLEAESALARSDGLTGLDNARAFELTLVAERERLVRYNRVVSLVYFDLDNFKEVNDSYGHAAGDELLKIVGELVASGIRQVDSGARLGGDEFALILPETGIVGTEMVARRLSENIIRAARARDWPVTCSMGCVTFEGAPPAAEEMKRAADAAMYRAKHAGKNRIETQVWQ